MAAYTHSFNQWVSAEMRAPSGSPVRVIRSGDAVLWVDTTELFSRLGARALRNKTHKACGLHGAVKVTISPGTITTKTEQK